MENLEVKYKNIEANIYNYKAWITETNPAVLKNKFTQILSSVGYTILKHIEYQFPTSGYTCLWLLAESHLAIHTFPEKGLSYIELSGCNAEMNTAFEEITKNDFIIKR
jgi:S-adenosylmethionine decarboxylase